jgi:hypothetical protein
MQLLVLEQHVDARRSCRRLLPPQVIRDEHALPPTDAHDVMIHAPELLDVGRVAVGNHPLGAATLEKQEDRLLASTRRRHRSLEIFAFPGEV